MNPFNRSAISPQTLLPAQAPRLALTGILFSLLLLLTGCSLFRSQNQPEPDLLSPLPSDWTVLEQNGAQWQEVNIDGDPDPEYLLAYTYNNSAPGKQDGPVGISIYDLQNQTELGNRSDQPAPSYSAYRILPNYWSKSDTGFISEPGNYDVTVSSVTRVGNEYRDGLPDNAQRAVVEATPEFQTEDAYKLLNRELIIKGDNTTITFAWWRNLSDGYGVASIYAPGGFRDTQYPQKNDNLPPDSLNGLYPMDDRSLICTMVNYKRVSSEEAAYEIRYEPAVRGLYFCESSTPPVKPFYPEAVVLAYLLNVRGGDPGNWVNFTGVKNEEYGLLFTADETVDPLTGELTGDNLWKQNWLVYGLFGPKTLPYRGSTFLYTATVCAELVDPTSQILRVYRFTLDHSLPELVARRTDEWRITDIEEIMRPENGPPPDCSEIVKPGTPGRVNRP
ncbi:MAG: hypothetical protein ACK5NN_00435 [Sphingomonadaceae bacterium]